ncbi:hypothetical protein K402DRAFT_391540 [Aulographum hederae CBS 113979]|uniref:Uncharacterized protein n=1 Tax=Aulographum hederae CBS 113979 TaxID=1176131 RepID=A0A6G1H6Q8_9PEZI|nr:hypothetical protein K402DRAFT_391540 [Aulographum hederae CBS 113979]
MAARNTNRRQQNLNRTPGTGAGGRDPRQHVHRVSTRIRYSAANPNPNTLPLGPRIRRFAAVGAGAQATQGGGAVVAPQGNRGAGAETCEMCLRVGHRWHQCPTPCGHCGGRHPDPAAQCAAYSILLYRHRERLQGRTDASIEAELGVGGGAQQEPEGEEEEELEEEEVKEEEEEEEGVVEMGREEFLASLRRNQDLLREGRNMRAEQGQRRRGRVAAEGAAREAGEEVARRVEVMFRERVRRRRGPTSEPESP